MTPDKYESLRVDSSTTFVKVNSSVGEYVDAAFRSPTSDGRCSSPDFVIKARPSNVKNQGYHRRMGHGRKSNDGLVTRGPWTFEESRQMNIIDIEDDDSVGYRRSKDVKQKQHRREKWYRSSLQAAAVFNSTMSDMTDTDTEDDGAPGLDGQDGIRTCGACKERNNYGTPAIGDEEEDDSFDEWECEADPEAFEERYMKKTEANYEDGTDIPASQIIEGHLYSIPSSSRTGKTPKYTSNRKDNQKSGRAPPKYAQEPLQCAERQALLQRIRQLSSREAENAASLAQALADRNNLAKLAEKWEITAMNANSSLNAAREALADVSAENARLTAAFTAQRIEIDSLRKELMREKTEGEARLESLEAELAAARAEAEIHIFSDDTDADTAYTEVDVQSSLEEENKGNKQNIGNRKDFEHRNSNNNDKTGIDKTWNQERAELLSLLERLQEQLAIRSEPTNISSKEKASDSPCIQINQSLQNESLAFDNSKISLKPRVRTPSECISSENAVDQVNNNCHKTNKIETTQTLSGNVLDAATNKNVDKQNQGRHSQTPSAQEVPHQQLRREDSCISTESHPNECSRNNDAGKAPTNDNKEQEIARREQNESCSAEVDRSPTRGKPLHTSKLQPKEDRINTTQEALEKQKASKTIKEKERNSNVSSPRKLKATGELLMQAKRYEEALKIFTAGYEQAKTLQSKSLMSSMLCDRALVRNALGQPLEAAVDCCKAERLDHSCCIRATDIRASAYMAMGAFDIALNELSSIGTRLSALMNKKLDHIKLQIHLGVPRNLYAVLSIKPTATSSAVKAAYRARVKLVHPDKAADELGNHAATTLFSLLSEAHITLTNSQSRRSYDLELLKSKYIRANANGSYRSPASKNSQNSGGAGWGPPRV